MRTGISSYTYTWAVGVTGHEPVKPLSAFHLVDKASELGVQVLQIADNLPLHLNDLSALEKLAEYARIRGLILEVGARELTTDNLDRYIRIAALLASRILRFIIDGVRYEPDAATVISVIRSRLSLLEKHQLALALENHDRLHSASYRMIVETIDHPLVGICLDSVNSLGIAEGLDTVVENLAPFTLNLHVKDFSIKRMDHKMGFLVEGVPAGKGMLNLPAILEKLSHFGRCTSAVLELWTPPASDLGKTIEQEDAWARESITYMKQILNR